MARPAAFGRRTFLRATGLGALAGAAGTAGLEPALGAQAPSPAPARYDFDTVYDRVGTDSSKWDAQIARYGRERIEVGMGTADQDFRIAPAITEALRARMAHENYGYLTVPESYLDSIARWNQRRYGLTIDPGTILHAAGVHPALISTLRAFSPPGSKVLVLAPTYDGFYADIRIVGAVANESPLVVEGGRYRIDFDDFERRIDHDTHAFILCNPQNPTGNVWSRDDLARLGEICLRRRVVLLADEIHCDFVTRGHRYTPFATLDDPEVVRNSLTYKSVSKSFNLSAMRIAYCFSTNPDYLDRVRGAGQHRQALNTLAIYAARAAYDECEDWLDQLVAYIDDTHTYVESFVRAHLPRVDVVKPEGTYLAWLDVARAMERAGIGPDGGDGDETPEEAFQQLLVDRARVHLNPGSSYGLGGAGHMRINIATSRRLVERALTNLAAALA